MDLNKAVLLIASGVIFDTIPKDVLEKDGNREKLLDAIMADAHGPLYRKATQLAENGGPDEADRN